ARARVSSTPARALLPCRYERIAPGTTVRGGRAATTVPSRGTAGVGRNRRSTARALPGVERTESTVGAGRRGIEVSLTVVRTGRTGTPAPAVRNPATTGARSGRATGPPGAGPRVAVASVPLAGAMPSASVPNNGGATISPWYDALASRLRGAEGS